MRAGGQALRVLWLHVTGEQAARAVRPAARSSERASPEGVRGRLPCACRVAAMVPVVPAVPTVPILVVWMAALPVLLAAAPARSRVR